MVDDRRRWRAILTLRRAEELAARGEQAASLGRLDEAERVRRRAEAKRDEAREAAEELDRSAAREHAGAAARAGDRMTVAALERAARFRERVQAERDEAERASAAARARVDVGLAAVEAARARLEESVRRRQAVEKEGRRRRSGVVRVRSRREEVALDDALRGRRPAP